ncbi:MAG: MBL fold metallo-hydrolase [Clostridia bacterium]|nr:MBL fold metallo-hydrolase [Clostridia bacterium]
MKLCFLGATHEVTGSCFLLTVGDKRVLIDCGMEQGKDIYENQPIPGKISDVDYVFLTHAHIDHSGNLPMLYKKGFRGKIYLTNATAKLANIMLKDSAHIQEFEAEWRNRKAKRSGGELYEPLYTTQDAIGTINLFTPCPYGKDITIDENVKVNFLDAGHMLGSSSIKLTVQEKGVRKTIIFSGDVGNLNKPLLKDPELPDSADYVVIESTYGNRNHGGRPNYVEELSKLLIDTFSRGGNLVIPSFAVGRTQEILYVLREIKQKRLVKQYSDFPVYVDSPLANEATEVFVQCLEECGDDETQELIRAGIDPISFEGLYSSVTTEESKAINFDQTPKVIISASGMCEAGRIRHHLKHNLWRDDSTILFVGYQSEGTLGRALLDGEKEIKLFSESIEVRARIENLDGISGHADRDGLINWLNGFENKPKRVFVVHGEDKVCDEFSDYVQNNLAIDSYAPFSGTEWDLLTDTCATEGVGRLIVKGNVKKKKYSSQYAKLLSAGEKLMTLIRESEGYANREIEKRVNEINRIISRW